MGMQIADSISSVGKYKQTYPLEKSNYSGRTKRNKQRSLAYAKTWRGCVPGKPTPDIKLLRTKGLWSASLGLKRC